MSRWVFRSGSVGLLVLGCSRSPVIVATDEGTSGGEDASTGGGDSQAPVDVPPDVPEEAPPSCESLGAAFGIVEGPSLVVPPAAGFDRFAFGVAALPEGRVVTFAQADDIGTIAAHAVAFSGGTPGEPVPIWAGEHSAPSASVATEEGVLLLDCGSPMSWAFVDASGRPGRDVFASALEPCLDVAAASIPGGAIVASLSQCDANTCMRAAATTVDALVAEPAPLEGEAFQSFGTTIAAAAATDTALIAAPLLDLARPEFDRMVLAARLLDHEANALFPEFRIELPPSGGNLFRPIGMAADDDGGYLVGLGGFGGRVGRLRLDAQGTPLEDFTLIDNPAGAPGGNAFATTITIARRPGGFVLIGDAGQGAGLIIGVLDRHGEFVSSSYLGGAKAPAAVAADGERVLVVYEDEGVRSLELGCVR